MPEASIGRVLEFDTKAETEVMTTSCDFPQNLQEKLKKLLDETRPLQLAFVKDKATGTACEG